MKQLIKYFFIVYFYTKQSRQYWMNVMLLGMSTVITTYISCNVWESIHSSGSQSIDKIVQSIVCVNLIHVIMSDNFELEIAKDVSEGNISVNLLKPIHYVSYIFSRRLGYFIFKLCCFAFPITVILLVYNVNIEMDIFVIISFILSYFMIFFLETLIGLSAFITTQVFGLSLIKSAFISLAAGFIIPLDKYPIELQSIFYNCPIPSIYCSVLNMSNRNLPNSILQKLFRIAGVQDLKLSVILEQCCWLLILCLVVWSVWKKCRKSLIIHGG